MTQSDKPFKWPPFKAGSRHMTVVVRFDRESFDALKALLYNRTAPPCTPRGEETATARIDREALLRVFHQIRDMKYNDSI